ncbi:hypothetical protein [Opitutus sp. ER46]|uniref:hypothetical protein n=1 Tax=Opitutus sp. ER46 TaxID=2161864 RepID=UPI000D324F24|nr:hypothetical protein [Opitutus sp. ER46]PTX99023.1 hypothetical protein DB354_03115 [Opitutus sp. ER46]
MKRIEVKLALPVVAPLLDVIRELADGLRHDLAAPLALNDIDEDLREAWVGDLLEAQSTEVQALLGLFNEEFFSEGVVAFDEENAETIVRACAAVRLRLREHHLKDLADEVLEAGEVDLQALDETLRRAFMCYLFLATIQELIIQHLDESILDG